ncbi:MAG: S8 family peptidase [Saprospiraceae bacterium]|nr:S8 family peptidase [Saprospiraceae bacterium]MBK8632828.1 S8 family peptidase [Saprospiraceae bacterium]MBP7641715.1 S8 family peptidase [Saprospiraceae bacterium]
MKRLLLILLTAASFININAQGTQGNITNWFHLSSEDGYNGIGSDKAYKELIKSEGQTVVVAIIDSGVDIDHQDLKDNIWTNPGEIPDNGIDDDKNGYIDDVHGWNFIGGPDGKNVDADSYEGTRVYNKLKYKYANADPAKINKTQKEEYELFKKVEKEVLDKKTQAESELAQIDEAEGRIIDALNNVEKGLKAQNLNLSEIKNLDVSEDTGLAFGKRVVQKIMEDSPGRGSIEEIKEFILFELLNDKREIQKQLEFAYNTEFDPRADIVKDNYADSYEKYYGNNDVEGPDPLHGTHVAGIVGAVRNNNIGMNGIAANVKLMSVRTVPDGDERDKDVANAIRYAVDNGASIINMSFGKAYSWDKKVVNEAVKYAASKDVLLVHAAGNSGENTDIEDNFPNDHLGKSGFLFFKKEKYAKNWIEVGALSHKKGEDAVAGFSNYGTKEVDIFSPGVQIYATVPNNQYRFLQGTSMASPVVAGLAAVLRSQYPALTAEQVKSIIMTTGTPITDKVKQPGTQELVPFNTLSVSGKIVNLEKALQMAATIKGKKKTKTSGV